MALLRLVALLAGLFVPALFGMPAAAAETRLALIITNANYPAEVGVLTNPHKDGELIAAALKNVGFQSRNIVILKDADQPQMRQAIAEFILRIEKAGSQAVAFFYYSGHGAADRSERGENYLIPVGAKISSARQLPILAVSISELTKTLERVQAKARFIVLDACRNVAFSKGSKDATKGFIPERRLDGIILAFATRPGETADDNNVYAGALASILPTPGLEAEQVFKETQRKVADLSHGTQIPWTEDGLLARFRFKDAPASALAKDSHPDEQQIARWRDAATPAVFKMQSAYRTDWAWAKGFGDRLSVLSGSKLKVEIEAPGTTVPVAEQLKAISDGKLAWGWGTPGLWGDTSAALHIYSGQVPEGLGAHQFLSWLTRRGDAERNELYQRQLQLKVHSIACGVELAEGIWFRKPVTSPQDLKGMRIRTGAFPAMVMRKLGMEPQSVLYNDIVSALENGSLDGAEFGQPWADDSLGLPKAAKHYYYPGWHAPMTLYELQTHLTTWDSLSEAQRGLIREACRQNIDRVESAYAHRAKEAIDRIKSKGVQVHNVPKGVLAAVRSARDEVARELSAKDPDFKRVWESYIAYQKGPPG